MLFRTSLFGSVRSAAAAGAGVTGTIVFRIPCRRGMKVYTRTGDKGKSSLYNGERRSKADTVFEALGMTDELSALLGILCEEARALSLRNYVTQIPVVQSMLLDFGSHIATPISSPKTTAERKDQTALPRSHLTTLSTLYPIRELYDCPNLTNKSYALEAEKTATELHTIVQHLYRQGHVSSISTEFTDQLLIYVTVTR